MDTLTEGQNELTAKATQAAAYASLATQSAATIFGEQIEPGGGAINDKINQQQIYLETAQAMDLSAFAYGAQMKQELLSTIQSVINLLTVEKNTAG